MNTELCKNDGDFLCISNNRDLELPINTVVNHLETQITSSLTGAKGSVGLTGNKGSSGDYGDIGSKGEKGVKGLPGKRGALGIKGRKGLTGITGPGGIRGLSGDKGDYGSPGYKGNSGNRGFFGKYGYKGVSGNFGERGQKGEPGSSGISSLTIAEKGNRGDPGENASFGPRGERGEFGETGSPGQKGQRGDRGQSGYKVGQINHALFGAKIIRNWTYLGSPNTTNYEFSKLLTESQKLKYKFFRVLLKLPVRNDLVTTDTDFVVNLEVPGIVTNFRPILVGQPPLIWAKSSSDFTTFTQSRSENKVPCSVVLEYTSDGLEFGFYISTQKTNLILDDKIYLTIDKVYGTDDI